MKATAISFLRSGNTLGVLIWPSAKLCTITARTWVPALPPMLATILASALSVSPVFDGVFKFADNVDGDECSA